MYYLGRWMFTIPSLLGSLKSKLKANILKCLFVFCTIFPISSPLFRRLNFQLLLSEATNLLQMQKKFKKVRTAATATFPHTYPMIRVSQNTFLQNFCLYLARASMNFSFFHFFLMLVIAVIRSTCFCQYVWSQFVPLTV